jgi:hypothetical protein
MDIVASDNGQFGRAQETATALCFAIIDYTTRMKLSCLIIGKNCSFTGSISAPKTLVYIENDFRFSTIFLPCLSDLSSFFASNILTNG